MIKQKRQWVFVVDERGGRLLECSRVTPNDRCRVEEHDAIPNTLLPHDEKGKPVKTGVPGVSYADPDRDQDVMRDQFAAEVGSWLDLRVNKLDIDSLDLFAPPEFLGALRKTIPASVRDRLQEHDANLTWMSPADLSRHPAIVRLVGIAS
ncbi:MAG: baeRF12 domain-containing protein [Planctomycetota bacterium]|jgi:protein required for attachment to host cells